MVSSLDELELFNNKIHLEMAKAVLRITEEDLNEIITDSAMKLIESLYSDDWNDSVQEDNKE